MPIDEICGMSCPTHFLKSRGSVVRNNFLGYRTNKATHELIRLFSCSNSDTIYNKSIKENRKKSHF